jgi:hypothetical protein
VGPTPRSRKSGQRPNPKDYPAHFSREYPVREGHHYSLNGVPRDIWNRAKKRAHADDRSIRVILIRALELYGSGRIHL